MYDRIVFEIKIIFWCEKNVLFYIKVRVYWYELSWENYSYK